MNLPTMIKNLRKGNKYGDFGAGWAPTNKAFKPRKGNRHKLQLA